MNHENSEVDRSIGDLVGILAIDVRKFSRHDDTQQRTIVALLPEILRSAADRARLPGLWDGGQFTAFRGDGYLLGLPVSLVPAAVDRYFDALQAELRTRSRELRADGIELRLRASLHLGPVSSFDAILTDSPTGQIMVQAGRMVDAAPVRALLDHSDPDVTFVAAVVSESVMEHVVRAGLTARRPSEFVESPLQVDAKDYTGVGHLRVPVPSGELLAHGLLRAQSEPLEPPSPGEPQDPTGSVTNTVTGHANDVVQARDVHGGIDARKQMNTGTSVAVHGNGNVAAGNNVSTTNQEFSGTFTTQRDANFGPDSGQRTAEEA